MIPMLSVDTNILFVAHDSSSSGHEEALSFVRAHRDNQRFVICELVLVELYLLLRNPIVSARPLSAAEAVAACGTYRSNPSWRLVENAPVMGEVWRHARARQFARRRIIDTRLALTLRHHGVREFATANAKDFKGFGFARVWNPLSID